MRLILRGKSASVAGYAVYLDRYRAGLAIERAATAAF